MPGLFCGFSKGPQVTQKVGFHVVGVLGHLESLNCALKDNLLAPYQCEHCLISPLCREKAAKISAEMEESVIVVSFAMFCAAKIATSKDTTHFSRDENCLTCEFIECHPSSFSHVCDFSSFRFDGQQNFFFFQFSSCQVVRCDWKTNFLSVFLDFASIRKILTACVACKCSKKLFPRVCV